MNKNTVPPTIDEIIAENTHLKNDLASSNEKVKELLDEQSFHIGEVRALAGIADVVLSHSTSPVAKRALAEAINHILNLG